jgi:hypothetical protein
MGGAEHLALRELTHCTLFELSERSERCELCNAPMDRAPQVARSASAGTWGPGAAFFCLLFLAEQEK